MKIFVLCNSDSGHVMKAVFGTDENGDSEPVIVEDIEVCVHLCSTYIV